MFLNTVWMYTVPGKVRAFGTHTAERDNTFIVPLTGKSVCFQNALLLIVEWTSSSVGHPLSC